MPAISKIVIPTDTKPVSPDIMILEDYLFHGLKQVEIAEKYGISQQGVSHKVRKILNDENVKNKLVSSWEKEYSLTARKKALELINTLDPSKVSDGSKATSSAILVDKARLIDNESTSNVSIDQHITTKDQGLERIAQLQAERAKVSQDR